MLIFQRKFETHFLLPGYVKNEIATFGGGQFSHARNCVVRIIVWRRTWALHFWISARAHTYETLKHLKVTSGKL